VSHFQSLPDLNFLITTPNPPTAPIITYLTEVSAREKVGRGTFKETIQKSRPSKTVEIDKTFFML